MPGPDQRRDHGGGGHAVRMNEHAVRVPLDAVDPGAARTAPSTARLRLRACRRRAPSGADDLADRPGREPRAHAHDHHVGAGLLYLGEHVAGQDHGPARRAAYWTQHVAHLPDLRRVQAVHRLVEHQQVRQAEHGLGDGQPLAHAARVGAHGRSMAAPRPAISSTSARCESPAGRPVARQYRSRLARPDRCGRKPGPSTNEPEPGQGRRPGRTSPPEDRDRARVGLDQAHQHPQRGRLARPVRAEQPEDLAALHPQGHPVHREVTVLEPLGQLGDLQRHAARSPGTGDRSTGAGGARRRGRAASRISPPATAAASGAAQVHHGRPPLDTSQGRVRRQRRARGRPGDLVDGRGRRGGVAEVGGGQHEPEPVPGRRTRSRSPAAAR